MKSNFFGDFIDNTRDKMIFSMRMRGVEGTCRGAEYKTHSLVIRAMTILWGQ